MKRFLANVRERAAQRLAALRTACAAALSRLRARLAAAFARVRPWLVLALRHVRHPTKRGLLLAAAAVPLLFVLYVIVLIPFTPSIGDLRRARVDAPAQILSADGKVLAEFEPNNRAWVPLGQISPHMVDALI